MSRKPNLRSPLLSASRDTEQDEVLGVGSGGTGKLRCPRAIKILDEKMLGREQIATQNWKVERVCNAGAGSWDSMVKGCTLGDNGSKQHSRIKGSDDHGKIVSNVLMQRKMNPGILSF